MFKKACVTTMLSLAVTGISFADVKIFNNDNFDVLIGGEFGAEAGAPVQKAKYRNRNVNNAIVKGGVTTNNKTLGMDSFGSAHTTVQNMANKNFSYGAHIGIKTTTRSEQPAGKGYLERSYVFMEGEKWGRVELGANEGASRAMMIKGKKFDAGEGNWDNYISLNTYSPDDNFKTQQMSKKNFVKSAKLILQESKYETNHEAFRKVTYYTPQLKGFQFGISYIPDATNKGGEAVFQNENNSITAEEKNAFSAGLKWEHSFAKDHSLAIALVGETGKVKQAKAEGADAAQKGEFHKTKAVAIGAAYNVGKQSFAVAVGDRFKSGFKKDLTDQSNNSISPGKSLFFSVGGAYKICDNSSVSLTYLHGDNNNNKLNVAYAGIDYTGIEGVKVYADAAYFTAKQTRNYDAVNGKITTGQNFKNSGAAVVTGIKIKF